MHKNVSSISERLHLLQLNRHRFMKNVMRDSKPVAVMGGTRIFELGGSEGAKRRA